jgi:hypothetical protein
MIPIYEQGSGKGIGYGLDPFLKRFDPIATRRARHGGDYRKPRDSAKGPELAQRMHQSRTVYSVSDAVEDLGRGASHSLQTIEQQFCVAVVELNILLGRGSRFESNRMANHERHRFGFGLALPLGCCIAIGAVQKFVCKFVHERCKVFSRRHAGKQLLPDGTIAKSVSSLSRGADDLSHQGKINFQLYFSLFA